MNLFNPLKILVRKKCLKCFSFDTEVKDGKVICKKCGDNE